MNLFNEICQTVKPHPFFLNVITFFFWFIIETSRHYFIPQITWNSTFINLWKAFSTHGLYLYSLWKWSDNEKRLAGPKATLVGRAESWEKESIVDLVIKLWEFETQSTLRVQLITILSMWNYRFHLHAKWL